jgi:antitoxin component YwqK of YwqJK toxin-antitoxin module
MKKLLTATFAALLMVGCGSPDLDNKETLDEIIAEAIDMDKLQGRGQKGEKLLYAPNEQTPYTGWAYEIGRRGNGQKDILLQLKDGKLDGLLAMFHENGQKEAEINLKDGKLMSAKVWKPNGERCPATNVKDGNGVMVEYKEDGTEKRRQTYKDGISVRN